MPLPPNSASLWRRLLRRGGGLEQPTASARTHIVLLDGTMSSLEPGRETSIGLIWKMLREEDQACLYYEPGIEWRGVRNAPEVMAGVGINRQIRRAYTFLAHRYAPGDRVFLLGYSRGAYAVRALAGMIDRVGLLRDDALSEEMVQVAYDHYREDPTSLAARSFAARHCHETARITAVGVFDTVQAVGIRWPVLWRLFPQVHAFRSHRLGASVDHGFHAMALDENRRAFSLDRWRTRGARTQTVEQVWFRGSHGDIGGHLAGRTAARPLANVSLVWMLERMTSVGMSLPEGWRARFPVEASAPSAGNWRGFGVLFLARARRRVGLDPSESLHPTVARHRAAGDLPLWEEAGVDGASARLSR